MLWFHPAGGERVYEGLRDDVDAWMIVHGVLLIATPLLVLATFCCLVLFASAAVLIERTRTRAPDAVTVPTTPDGAAPG